MSQAQIAITIVAITLVLYLTEVFPVVVTSILSMLALAASGVITYSECYTVLNHTILPLQ